ncbi:MAG TPA: ATP-dependent zinc metalloprotease FtsH [bacterium]|nr:ATP-dependent zinc metalloprotease FtsH [bacterium]HPS30351.1 ATP-dependent zinc metalloprotease FtsH [bacterium]
MKFNYKSLLVWLGIIVVVFFLINISQLTSKKTTQELNMTEFRAKVKAGEIKEVSIDGLEFKGKLNNDNEFIVIGPSGEKTTEFLSDNNVPTTYVKPDDDSFLQSLLVSWLPMLVFVLLFIFFMRQMQGGNGKAFSFGKSKHRVISKDQNPIRFKDVAGVDESKEELTEVVDFLKRPALYTKMGAKIPHGVLLVGPPGTGKTMLAKAVAGEADVPFFIISGSDFVEMFVGVGASRVRDLFNHAKEKAPCIIFVDEIDAVGRQRGAGLGGGHDEREQTLNQLLVEMDGFGSDAGVIVIAATNRADVLDPALLRPGRFDRQVYVPMPDIKGRELILKVHAEKIRMEGDINYVDIARGTPGFSGADLANLLNEAALLAASKTLTGVTMNEIEEARDKILMGKERKTMVLTPDEKKDTAYHEAGHVIVGIYSQYADPIHKVSIIPRGHALGVTQHLPEKDKYSYHKEELIDKIKILMGGRVAEELFIGRITTGAGNDIERATQLARNMVMMWGMSENLGPVHYGENEQAVFLGRELGKRTQVSEATSEKIDDEVQKIIDEAYLSAKNILDTHRDEVARLVDSLMEHETLSKDAIMAALGGTVTDAL